MTGHILVASTMTRFATGRPETSTRWLDTAGELVRNSPLEVQFFAALEMDGGTNECFAPVMDRLTEVDNPDDRPLYWWYRIEDYRSKVSSANRLHHIVTGRNLITEYAVGTGAEWILFLDADMRPPGDAIPKLLELEWPVVGGEVPTYGLSGPEARLKRPDSDALGEFTWTAAPYPFPVQEHMNTAGFLMVRRDVFRKVRWRIDPDEGLTDDPCYHQDVTRLGYPTYVRKDVIGSHWPEAIPALEQRGYDLRVR